MSQIFQTMLIGLTIVLLAGCDGANKNQPIWEQVKITDLALSNGPKPPSRQLLQTIDFTLYVFEVRAEEIVTLTDIWQTLHTSPFKFDDYQALQENLFLVGFGQLQTWDQIRDVLQAAGAKKVQTISLLLADGYADEITIADVDDQQALFYLSNGSAGAVTIGPGKLVLRVRANKIPGSRGVCSTDIRPVFLSATRNFNANLSAKSRDNEYTFTSLGFRLKMSPGDFILIGPKRYITQQNTLASLFFSSPKPKPFTRIYLFVCLRIED